MRLALVAALVGVASCSALTSLDDLRGGASNDSGSSDAPAGELFTNPDFEEGTGGCGPGWYGDRATLTRSTTAHKGQYSCQVCVQSGETLFNFFPTATSLASAQPGETYFASLWVSTVAGQPVNEIGAQLDVDSNNLAFQGGDVNAAPGWQQVQLNGVVQAAGEINFAVHGGTDTAGSGCYLLDDMTLVKQ
jgi:hypothetical protein